MTRPKVPVEVIIEITGQCPLHCNYCTNPAGRAKHLPLSTIQKILREAAKLHIPAIRFTGGEPLLHPQLREMLTLARQLKLYTIINTSAENVSPAQLRTLSANADCVLVSLQGYNQVSNKDYTHSGTAFSQKLKNIFALKALVPTLRLGTVITPNLLNSFPRFAALVRKISPASWGLFRAVSGHEQDIARMDHAFYKKLVLNILKLRQNGINARISNAIPMCVAGNINAAQAAMSGSEMDDGHLRIVFDARGFFKPSYFINENLGKTIKDAWAHPLLKTLSSTRRLPTMCRSCALLKKCLGGCRAMSYKTDGSYTSADPLMPAER